MRMRLEPEDDYLHPAEEASNFNESRYYNWFDSGRPDGRLGADGQPAQRGLRRDDGLPVPARRSHRVHLQAPAHRGTHRARRRRPAVRSRCAVREAPHHVRRARCASSPSRARWPILVRPSRTTRSSRVRSISTLEAVGKPWGGEPEWEEGEEKPDLDPEKLFARGHTEQHMRSTGTVRIGEETFEITNGLGLRDHSWGPRFWQNIWWYRWLTVNLGPDLGFACTVSGNEAGERRTHGFLYDVERYGDTQWVPIRKVELSSDYDKEWFPTKNKAVVTTDDHVYEVEGDVWSNIPLRNRRAGHGDPHHRRHDALVVRRATTVRDCPSISTRSSVTPLSEPTSVSDHLRATLEPVLGAPVHIDALQRLSGGASRETWSFTADGRELILRRDPPGRPGIAGVDAQRGGRDARVRSRRAARSRSARRRRRHAARHCRPRHGPRAGRDARPPDPARRRVRPRPRPCSSTISAASSPGCTPSTRPRCRARSRRTASRSTGTRTACSRIGAPRSRRRTTGSSSNRPPRTATTLVHGDLRLGNIIVDPTGSPPPSTGSSCTSAIRSRTWVGCA